MGAHRRNAAAPTGAPTVSKKTFAIAAAGVLLLTTSIASAEDVKRATPANQDKQASGPEHPTTGTLQVQAMTGITNAGLGVGAGVRVGYTLPNKLYLGASFKMNYREEDVRYFTYITTFYRPGVDVGYDVSTGPVVLRPYVGGGMAAQRVDIIDTDRTNNKGDMTAAAWTGLQLLGHIPKTRLFVGADVSTFLVASDVSEHPIEGNVVFAARF